MSHTAAGTPPGPKGRRLVGNLQDYEADRLGFLERAHRDFGPVVRFDDGATIVNDVELARIVLRGSAGEFQISEDFLQRRLRSSDIETVLRVRPHLDPGLRPAAMAPLRPTIVGLVERAVHNFSRYPTDPMPLMEEITSRAITTHYFGADGETLRPQVGRLLDALSEVIGNPFALPASVWSPRRHRIRRRHMQTRDAVVGLLEARKRRPERFDDAASVLLRGAERRNPHPLPRLADLIVGAMLAGYRVPAASLSWLFMLVADSPTIQERLARDDTESGRASPNAGGQLTFANACVLEALRLYPATWLISRNAPTPTTLGSWQFGSNHTFLISPWIIHRDPANFTAAAEFQPDRWLTSDRRTSHAYIPFGHGAHACPGNNFAVTTMSATLETIVRTHTVSRSNGTVTPDVRTTLVPSGLRVQFEPRTRASERSPVPALTEAGL